MAGAYPHMLMSPGIASSVVFLRVHADSFLLFRRIPPRRGSQPLPKAGSLVQQTSGPPWTAECVRKSEGTGCMIMEA